MSNAEHEVGALLEDREQACRDKDIERLMSLYSPDIIYFDVVPPLHFSGADAVRKNFLRWFDEYDGPIGLETHQLKVAAGDNVAIAHMLHLDTGAMQADGSPSRSLWLRSTVCLERTDTQWLITHEHISLPVALDTMQAVLDATP
jgi:uncharacterized protein (TIGR02246 family)